MFALYRFRSSAVPWRRAAFICDSALVPGVTVYQLLFAVVLVPASVKVKPLPAYAALSTWIWLFILALDTAPFALNGQPTVKPDYFQQRLGATLGGPLVIPHLVNSPRTFFFVNYTGNHSRNPYDAYSTVPTLAERAGDLSAIARTLVDPVTGQPFLDNQLPGARLDPAAQKLLSLPEVEFDWEWRDDEK